MGFINNSASNELILSSTDNLSLRLSDFANVFILPPICGLGMLLNLACIIVVSQKQLAGELYTFILFHSICDFIFLFINTFTCVIRCGVYCPYGYSFPSKVWELYVHLFVGNVFLLFGNGLDIVVSFNRLFSFSSTRPRLIDRFNKMDLKIKCLVIAVVSIVVNIPSYIITREVQLYGYLETTISGPHNSTTSTRKPLYLIMSNSFGQNSFIVGVLFVLTLLRGVFPLMVLFFINLLIAYKFRLYLRKKRRIMPITVKNIQGLINKPISNELPKMLKSEQNTTKMIMTMCVIFLLGNVPNSISPVLFTVHFGQYWYNVYVLFGNLMLFVSRSSYFFIYAYFNNNFRQTLLKIFIWK